MGLIMLTLICGLPNAGKTTFSKRYENALHQDDIGSTSNVIKAIGQTGGDVFIEGYFGTQNERRKVLSAYNDSAKCIFIDISTEESIRRENRNRHPQILRNASKYFEPPTLDEGWDEIIIIRGDNNVECISRKE